MSDAAICALMSTRARAPYSGAMCLFWARRLSAAAAQASRPPLAKMRPGQTGADDGTLGSLN
jgi:hypothetical protein